MRQYINNQNEQLSWKSFDYLTEDDGDNLRGDNGADTSICLKTLAETTVKGHPDARTVPTKIANKVLFDKMGQKAAEEAMDKLNRRDILRWVTGKDGVSNVKITFGLYLEVTKICWGKLRMFDFTRPDPNYYCEKEEPFIGRERLLRNFWQEIFSPEKKETVSRSAAPTVLANQRCYGSCGWHWSRPARRRKRTPTSSFTTCRRTRKTRM